MDTNVIVYAFDEAEPGKRQQALRVLAEHPDAAISTQVLMEWHSVVTRKFSHPLDPLDAFDGLQKLARLDVTDVNAELVLKAAATSTSHQLSIWDALIVEAAVHAGCRVLLTEDLTEGQTIRGLTVVNPFG